MKRRTKTAQKPDVKQSGSERIERKYSNDKSKCLILFRLPKDFAPAARSIAVAGSFNDWDRSSHPLKKQKSGEFSCGTSGGIWGLERDIA